MFGFSSYVVCIEFPRESYHYTEIVAGVGSAAGMLCMLVVLLKGARRVPAITLYVGALCVIVFDLVWSMIIVGQHWGDSFVFVLNMFTAGVGTILAAMVASLIAGDLGRPIEAGHSQPYGSRIFRSCGQVSVGDQGEGDIGQRGRRKNPCHVDARHDKREHEKRPAWLRPGLFSLRVQN